MMFSAVEEGGEEALCWYTSSPYRHILAEQEARPHEATKQALRDLVAKHYVVLGNARMKQPPELLSSEESLAAVTTEQAWLIPDRGGLWFFATEAGVHAWEKSVEFHHKSQSALEFIRNCDDGALAVFSVTAWESNGDELGGRVDGVQTRDTDDQREEWTDFCQRCNENAGALVAKFMNEPSILFFESVTGQFGSWFISKTQRTR